MRSSKKDIHILSPFHKAIQHTQDEKEQNVYSGHYCIKCDPNLKRRKIFEILCDLPHCRVESST